MIWNNHSCYSVQAGLFYREIAKQEQAQKNFLSPVENVILPVIKPPRII